MTWANIGASWILLSKLREMVASHRDLTTKFSELEKKYDGQFQIAFEAIRQLIAPRDAFYSDSELVNVNDSAGRVSTEIVTVYPPGIPLLVPGEEISRDAID